MKETGAEVRRWDDNDEQNEAEQQSGSFALCAGDMSSGVRSRDRRRRTGVTAE